MQRIAFDDELWADGIQAALYIEDKSPSLEEMGTTVVFITHKIERLCIWLNGY